MSFRPGPMDGFSFTPNRSAPGALRLSTPNPPSRGPSPAGTIPMETPAGYASGQRTPTEMRPAQRRRLTLISLIDELTTLRDEEAEKERSVHLMYDEKRDGPHDERLQKEGVANFTRFEKRIKGLDKELQSFINATRQLGSSVGLLSSAFQLRARLSQLLHLFRLNAAELFEDIHKEDSEPTWRLHTRKKGRKRRPTELKLRAVLDITSDPEAMPFELELLANDLNTFLECLNQIPEFNDEGVNQSVNGFQTDLRYWASCLRDFQDQFRWPSVERHVHELALEMEEHIENITLALTVFVDVGVTTIRFTQRQTADALQSLSTVATFFSAVTASTLQYSYQSFETRVEQAVNLLWLISLVFSLASAINSQLAYHWRSAIYRSPRSCVPWWVSIWITRTPLFFLVASVIAFSAGLVCFTFAVYSNRPFIPVVITVATSISSFALLAVGFWFAGERYAFSKTEGTKWLAQMLEESLQSLHDRSGISWFEKHFPSTHLVRAGHWIADRYRSVRSHLGRGRSSNLSIAKTSTLESSLENGHGFASAIRLAEDRAYQTASPEPIHPPAPIRQFSSSSIIRSPISSIPPLTPVAEIGVNGRTSIDSHPASPPRWRNGTGDSTTTLPIRPSLSHANTYPESRPTSPAGSTTESESEARRNFRALAAKVISQNRSAQGRPNMATIAASFAGGSNNNTPPESTKDAFTAMPSGGVQGAKSRAATMGTPGGFPFSNSKNSRGESGVLQPKKPPRLASIVPSLRSLATRETLNEHTALVRHLQFSPDGQFFATCSWDQTAIIWKVGQPFTVHRKLAHAKGFVGQVAWSPNGKFLLTKMTRGIKVWVTETGVCQKTIERSADVKSITWMPNSQSLLSVEGSKIHCLTLSGGVEWSVDLPPLMLHDVVVAPDGERLLGVATLETSPHGLQPAKSRREKRIFVYNFKSHETENQTPVLNEVRDITLSVSGKFALVSYEHNAPPQLFRIDKLRDHTTRLFLVHTYKPPTNVDFAGPSYLGHLPGVGTEDQLVLCAGKGGEVFIWDKSTARLLHSLKAHDQGSDLTGIAWNHASRTHLMFASAQHDGTVKVWTAPWSGMERQHSRRDWTDHHPKDHKRGDRNSHGGMIIVESPRPMKATSPTPSIIS